MLIKQFCVAAVLIYIYPYSATAEGHNAPHRDLIEEIVRAIQEADGQITHNVVTESFTFRVDEEDSLIIELSRGDTTVRYVDRGDQGADGTVDEYPPIADPQKTYELMLLLLHAILERMPEPV